VVDLASATRDAKQRLHALRQTPEVKAGKAAVVEKHASRKLPAARKKAKAASAPSSQQLGFDFSSG
jgi:deoxyribodipyrimidine photo-lyase